VRVNVRRWSRLFAAVGVLVSAIALVIWGLVALHRSALRHLDSTIGSVESKGTEHLTIALIGTFIFLIGIWLLVAWAAFDVFNPSKRKSELYWLYVTIAVLICFLFLEAKPFTIVPGENTGEIYARHPAYLLANARACLVIVLLIVGIGIYIFKCRLKLAYGLAEVSAAIVSNVAIISHLNLSSFPKVHFTRLDLFAICALAYLLSKGIGDAVEGVNDIMKKKRENIPQS